MTSFGHEPHGIDLFLLPVDQAKKAAEECPHQGVDDEVSEEYEHPPWIPGGYSLDPWRILPHSLEVLLVQLCQQTGLKFSQSRRAEAQRGKCNNQILRTFIRMATI